MGEHAGDHEGSVEACCSNSEENNCHCQKKAATQRRAVKSDGGGDGPKKHLYTREEMRWCGLGVGWDRL